jgi:hypothetical protein
MKDFLNATGAFATVWLGCFILTLCGLPTLGLSRAAFVTMLVIVIMVHEQGHRFFMERAGLRTTIVLDLPYGMAIRSDPRDRAKAEALSFSVKTLIHLGGTIASFFLWIVTALLGFVGIIEHRAMIALLSYDLVLIMFNLIPAKFVDGGQALELYLAHRYKSNRAPIAE